MNNKMKQLFETQNPDEISDQISPEIDIIVGRIVEKTRLVKDCVIFDEDESLDEKQIDFHVVMKFVGDWTGYEVSCNELKFSLAEIPVNQFLNFIEIMNFSLSQRYKKRKFVIILWVCDGEIDLRFHTYRKNEGLWLDEDLDQYPNPILYWI
ncbi:hypothetical protein [Methanobrevibacter sp.]|uniref:hypothetical protein n=1 Tax=Methanobrevibacter sp. TaxID=66852 RepID=UPI00386971FB